MKDKRSLLERYYTYPQHLHKIDTDSFKTSRRQFLKGGISALFLSVLVGAALKEAPVRVDWAEELKKFEETNTSIDIADITTLKSYSRLISNWYGEKLAEFKDIQPVIDSPRTGEQIGSSVTWEYHCYRTCTANDRVYIDLGSLKWFIKEHGLAGLRNMLVHQFTFLTEAKRNESIFLTSALKNSQVVENTQISIRGFRAVQQFTERDPSMVLNIALLNDYPNKLSTEVIAEHLQKKDSLSIVVSPGRVFNQYNAEGKTLMEKTLGVADISLDEFSILHANSNIDGLLTKLAEATDVTFSSQEDKINYGWKIFSHLPPFSILDTQEVSKYWALVGAKKDQI